MSQEEPPASQTAAGRLAVKLHAFFEALPDDEKRIMVRIMRLAVEREDVEGYSVEEPGQPAADLTAQSSPNPIDDFRANLGLFLGPDA